MDNLFSPLLSAADCQICQPDGEGFLTFVELGKKLKQVQKRPETAEQLRALGLELIKLNSILERTRQLFSSSTKRQSYTTVCLSPLR